MQTIKQLTTEIRHALDRQSEVGLDLVSKEASGLVPKLPNETSIGKFLRQDGTWAEPAGGSGGGSISANRLSALEKSTEQNFETIYGTDCPTVIITQNDTSVSYNIENDKLVKTNILIPVRFVAQSNGKSSFVYQYGTFKSIPQKNKLYSPTQWESIFILDQSVSLASSLFQNNKILGSKNLLPPSRRSQKIGGLTFDLQPDGSVIVNGSHTNKAYYNISFFDEETFLLGKRLVLSGCPKGGDPLTYSIQGVNFNKKPDGSFSTIFDYGSGVEFTYQNDAWWANAYVVIVVNANVVMDNVVFKPMLRLASDDDSYAPFAESNQQLTQDVTHMQNVLGTKNMLPIKPAGYSVNLGGYTLQCNEDGSYTIKGQESETTQYFGLWNYTDSQLPNGEYVLFQSGNTDDIKVIIDKYKDSKFVETIANSYARMRRFTVKYDDTYNQINIAIKMSVTSSPQSVTIYPMLCLASTSDYTYVPPAQTNRQLSVNLMNLQKQNEVLLSRNWGSRNLLVNTGKSKTVNGLVFTVNDDKSVTVNGTATAITYFNLSNQDFGDMSFSSQYTPFDCPYVLTAAISYDPLLFVGYNPKNRITSINVSQGKVCDNLVIKPMIQYASMAGGSYEPYYEIMSNKELTHQIELLSQKVDTLLASK